MRTRLRRLARRHLPAPPAPPPQPESAPPPPEPPEEERDALLTALERGRRLDEAVVAQARALIRTDEHHAALSLAESLRRHPETRALGHVVAGIVAYRQGYLELAHAELGDVPLELWARLAAAERVRAGLAVAPQETLDEVRALVAADPPDVGVKPWFDVLAPVFGYGAADTAREVFGVFDRRVTEHPKAWSEGEAHRDWMRPWVAADPDSPTAPATGRTTFAVMDYGHPGANRASANIGDHIQSLAALGHLVRHRGLKPHGEPELVGLIERLGERVRPERQLCESGGDVEVMTVHRDASMYEPIPEGTWVLCFGWYMHALFGIRHGFPLHRNLRPIFVSFHCNKRDLLTPEAVDYLKRYGPVGCRDWTTVYLLLSMGVPAFFSGCVTTTIDTLFPDAEAPGPDAPVGYVDAEPDDGGVNYCHSHLEIRRRSFVTNVDSAVERLETYRTRHRRIVTSRLHCYLPVRSLGVDVEFRPSNPADVRFDGLVGADLAPMRDALDAKLAPVFAAILAGKPEEELYELWRELTLDDVVAAQERMRRPAPPATKSEVEAATVVPREPPADAIHCAVVLPKGGGRGLAALLASLTDNASRRLHLWVLAPGGAPHLRRGLPQRFPQITFGWVTTRGLKRSLRLVLPDLLPRVDRLIVIPLPAVATADVAELADLDLGDHALAAPRRAGKDVSGFGVIHAAALRLEDPEAAAELRRTALARHRFDFDAFAGDVLVLDLARLRREPLDPVPDAFGLDDLEALHYLLGPDRATIPDRWAAAPTRTPARGPGLLHWPDEVKPWQRELTPERDRWRHYAALVRGGVD